MVVAQFVWGAVQPIAGAEADRYGPGRIIFTGIVLLALGSALTPLMHSTWGLCFSIGLLSAASARRSLQSVGLSCNASRYLQGSHT
jgi:MFS family permease